MQKLKNKKTDPNDYWCRHCGAENEVIELWSEVAYGHASVIDPNGDTDDYETDDCDNHQTTAYECTNCQAQSERLDKLITDDKEDVWAIIYGEETWVYRPR